MAVLNDDVNQLERFLDVGANQVILTISNVVFVGLAFFIISPTIAFLAFLPIPVIVAGSLRYQRTLEARYDAVRAAAGRIADTLTNNLGGITTIKAFTAEAREVERVAVDSRAYGERQRGGHPLLGRLHPAHPDGDPRRLHHDPPRRRARGARRRPSTSACTRRSST